MYSEDNHRIEIVSDETDVASSAPSETLASKGKLIKNQIQRILGFNTSTMLFVLIFCMIIVTKLSDSPFFDFFFFFLITY